MCFAYRKIILPLNIKSKQTMKNEIKEIAGHVAIIAFVFALGLTIASALSSYQHALYINQ